MTDRPALRRRPLTVPAPEMTHEQVALALGVSPVRIKQTEQRALVKLRRALNRRGITREDCF